MLVALAHKWTVVNVHQILEMDMTEHRTYGP